MNGTQEDPAPMRDTRREPDARDSPFAWIARAWSIAHAREAPPDGRDPPAPIRPIRPMSSPRREPGPPPPRRSSESERRAGGLATAGIAAALMVFGGVSVASRRFLAGW